VKISFARDLEILVFGTADAFCLFGKQYSTPLKLSGGELGVPEVVEHGMPEDY
jgi:hypothetical protein